MDSNMSFLSIQIALSIDDLLASLDSYTAIFASRIAWFAFSIACSVLLFDLINWVVISWCLFIESWLLDSCTNNIIPHMIMSHITERVNTNVVKPNPCFCAFPFPLFVFITEPAPAYMLTPSCFMESSIIEWSWNSTSKFALTCGVVRGNEFLSILFLPLNIWECYAHILVLYFSLYYIYKKCERKSIHFECFSVNYPCWIWIHNQVASVVATILAFVVVLVD